MANAEKATDGIQDGSRLTVTVGMKVEIEIRDKAGASERLKFTLVPDKQSDFSSGLMSERAPLAQAISGRGIGETVEYVPPAGGAQTVTILSIEPSARGPDQPLPDHKDILSDAMDEITRRESKQTALTAELHYGSLDPDRIEDE